MKRIAPALRPLSAACISCLLLAAPAPAPAQQSEGDAVSVTVTEVVAENLSPTVPVAGTIHSRNVMQITAGLAGRIEWVAEAGDFIPAGEAVARFDCRLLRLRLEEQQAQAERERINFETLRREAERLEKLRESQVASETQLARMQGDRDLAASEMRIASVRIRQTETELERCTATAPFSGVVTERMRHPGEDVERSAVLAAMTDTRNLEVRASVPIRYMPRVRTGDVAEVRMNRLRLEGRIRQAVPAGDAVSQTFQVRIDLPAAAPDLVAPGQLVSVSLPLAASSVMTIPRDSIVLREDGAFVMRINPDNTAESVPIEVADANGERVSVHGSLKPGDLIAVRGAESLDEGARVAVRTES